jgi:hypothetical protein
MKKYRSHDNFFLVGSSPNSGANEVPGNWCQLL